MREGDAYTTILNEPYPCEGCHHQDECAMRLLSCHAFHLYVTYAGVVDLSKREPSTAWYQMTFARERASPRKKDHAACTESDGSE